MSGYNFSRTPVDVPAVSTGNRIIKSKIPAPGTEDILAGLDLYESRSMHGQLPLIWDSAVGFNVFDIAGNKWIDFTSTIFVTNIGHSNINLVNSLKQALDKNLLHTYAYSNEIRLKYIKKLVEFSGFEKAFLLSAGTEATEAAVKLMRMNGQKLGKRRLGIICIEGNWHGRTMGAQMLSSNLKQREWIGFQDENIHHIPFPYPWDLNGKSGEEFFSNGLKKLTDAGIDIKQDICGFMLETFQGWGAVFYPDDFVQAVRKICDENKIILTFDEMQAGFARTGKKFGFEHYKVKADLICCGKGMGSGYPISGVLGSADVMDLPDIGNMSSTHSANPLSCVAGLSTIEEIERLKLVSESERKGIVLHGQLNYLKNKYSDIIDSIQGKGMVAAVIFKKGFNVDSISIIAEKCMQKGLLVVHTGRESIKIGPPLIITDEALKEGVDVLDESIFEAIK